MGTVERRLLGLGLLLRFADATTAARWLYTCICTGLSLGLFPFPSWSLSLLGLLRNSLSLSLLGLLRKLRGTRPNQSPVHRMGPHAVRPFGSGPGFAGTPRGARAAVLPSASITRGQRGSERGRWGR
jgi:hypothetical protein